MNATQRLTPKPPGKEVHLGIYGGVPVMVTPINRLASRSGCIWLITTPGGEWIWRARSDRGEEWAARGR